MAGKEKVFCHQAKEQEPETEGNVDIKFCLKKCRSVQKGVKAECPDAVKGYLRVNTEKNEGKNS